VDICGRTIFNHELALAHGFVIKIKASNPSLSKYLRTDDPGENIALKNNLQQEGVDTIVEFTAPNTPEQHCQVERSFVALWGRVRAMLNNSSVNCELRTELWAECAATATATRLCNQLSKKDRKSSFKLFLKGKVRLVRIESYLER
jgi:hypothetical protein